MLKLFECIIRMWTCTFVVYSGQKVHFHAANDDQPMHQFEYVDCEIYFRNVSALLYVYIGE